MTKKLFLNVSFTLLTLMFFMGVFCNSKVKAETYQDLSLYTEYIKDEFDLSDSAYNSFISELGNYEYYNIVRFETREDYITQKCVVYCFAPRRDVLNIGQMQLTDSNSTYSLTNTTSSNSVLLLSKYNSGLSNQRLVFIVKEYTYNDVSCYSLTTTTKSQTGLYNNTWDGWKYDKHFAIGSSVPIAMQHLSITNIYYWSYDEVLPYMGYYINNTFWGSLTVGSSSWQDLYSLVNPYVSDERLSIYSLESNNGKQLNIDISAFRSYTPAAFYNFSDIEVTLNCDGFDVLYTLDSNNSNIVDIWSSSNNVYTIQTLYTYFDLDSYEDVYISKVDFTLTVTSPGGSGDTDFNIACEYYLKKTHESMEPVIVPDPEYNNTEIYNSTQINNIKQDLHEYSSRFSFLQGSWIFVLEQDLPVFPGWATVYQNYVWFADGNSDTTYRGHWFQMANNIPSIVDLTRPFDPSEFLEQNKTFAFYDVILLKVFTVEVLSGSSPIDTYDLEGYLVFISDRYYDHYNARLNLDILTQLQLSAENSVLFFDAAKARLDGIAADLDTGFNGFLDVGTGTQYKIISWLQTINDNMSGSFISLENTLSDGFSSVVTAIGNITPGGSSYSLPALSDALSFLFTPTLEWSAINYDDYQESLGVLALPFEFTFDVLDICEAQYDPKFKIHLNELSLDVPLEAGSDPEMASFTVFEDQDIVQDPLDVIPSGLWSTLQYLNAFGLVMVQALSTYLHIFRKG